MTARPAPLQASGPRGRSGLLVVLTLAAITALTEFAIEGAHLGWWGSASWRTVAYRYGAFWAGLLHGWQESYPGQRVAMFLSYAFLHAGFWHLASNLVALLTIGPATARRAGVKGFLLIWFAAAIGGGIGFGLLSSGPSPMVGASGALFGLLGAWHYRDWRDRRANRRQLRPLIRAIVGLAVLNLIMWVLLSGLLAWQTHLGGYIAGWTASAALRVWRDQLNHG